MLETETVSSCLTVDSESDKCDIELHIPTLTDLANLVSEIINLMMHTRPTVGWSVYQSVHSSRDCPSANQITEFYAYLCLLCLIKAGKGCEFQQPIGPIYFKCSDCMDSSPSSVCKKLNDWQSGVF